eukprot:1911841-Rhodomonas_salina.2
MTCCDSNMNAPSVMSGSSCDWKRVAHLGSKLAGVSRGCAESTARGCTDGAAVAGGKRAGKAPVRLEDVVGVQHALRREEGCEAHAQLAHDQCLAAHHHLLALVLDLDQAVGAVKQEELAVIAGVALAAGGAVAGHRDEHREARHNLAEHLLALRLQLLQHLLRVAHQQLHADVALLHAVHDLELVPRPVREHRFVVPSVEIRLPRARRSRAAGTPRCPRRSATPARTCASHVRPRSEPRPPARTAGTPLAWSPRLCSLASPAPHSSCCQLPSARALRTIAGRIHACDARAQGKRSANAGTDGREPGCGGECTGSSDGIRKRTGDCGPCWRARASSSTRRGTMMPYLTMIPCTIQIHVTLPLHPPTPNRRSCSWVRFAKVLTGLLATA